MTASLVVSIMCDGDIGCEEMYQASTESVAFARALAGKEGWMSGDGGFDMCPACQKRRARTRTPQRGGGA